MAGSSKVYVVIPVFNKLEFTKKCLRSIYLQNYQNIETVVVDSGSIDNTVSYIKEKYPKVKIITGISKWFWTRSMFEGVKYILPKARDCDFVLTMNHDCYFKKNYIKSLVAAAKKNNNSIVGSMVVDADHNEYVMDAGILIDWSKASIYNHAKLTGNKLSYYAKNKIVKNLDTLPGKGTLIPIPVFKKIGNFNFKRLPHYIGDYEFFCRAKRYGFNLIVSCSQKLFNYSLQTGKSHLPSHISSYKEAFGTLFSRKSKLNLIDHFNFLLLCCPRKYLFLNLKQVYRKLLNYSLMVYPFYYLKFAIALLNRARLFLHNLPIKIKQNSLVSMSRLFAHNLPVKIRQFARLKQIKLKNSVKSVRESILYYIQPDNFTKVIKVLVFNVILKKPYVFKDWDENLYFQYPKDRVIYNIKRNAVSDAFNITNLVNRIVRDGFVCIDIGACIGATSVPMWKKSYPLGCVYSIEADPANIKLIKKNLKLNGYPTNKIFSYAIYRESRKVDLNIIEGINGWQSLGDPRSDERIKKRNLKIKTRAVHAITLEKFCEINQVNTIDFLKVDVEGAEIDVFMGAFKLLKEKAIKLLAFEISPQMLLWHNRKPKDVIRYISKYDYKIFKIHDDGTLQLINYKQWPENQHGDCLAVSDLKLLKTL